MKSGFATLVGRPNVGKSTLLNAICGTKVSIVSDKPQTTRNQMRGVLNTPGAQVVFVDTPGIHKPRTAAGERMNATATGTLDDVDIVCLVIDATAPIGKGDRFVATRVPPSGLCVLNKVDAATPEQIAVQLGRAAEFGLDEYFPISALTGDGVEELVAAVVSRLPEGPQYYPDDTVTDVPDALWVAELVREQLLTVAREELPHSIACLVTEWEWPRIRCEILVERDSQKGIVVGHGGSVLKAVGSAVRAQLRPGAYLELVVKVDKDWQRRPAAITRLGL
ncbi:MAG TPA: GTPase Era [Acidimicrobiales bacterium]|nr:GTPase Era [Acidimicrobiales bacterium]